MATALQVLCCILNFVISCLHELSLNLCPCVGQQNYCHVVVGVITSESEVIYLVLFQTQETSGRCRRGHMEYPRLGRSCKMYYEFLSPTMSTVTHAITGCVHVDTRL